jgi:hypothetical protein
MPERRTHTDTLRAGAPLTVGAVSLLPIERVVLYTETWPAHVWVSAAKAPYALIVRDAGGLRVVTTGTGTVTLEQLRESIPGLDALLESM